VFVGLCDSAPYSQTHGLPTLLQRSQLSSRMPSQRIFCFLQSLHARKAVLRICRGLVSCLLAGACEACMPVCTAEAPMEGEMECGSDWQRFRVESSLFGRVRASREWHLLPSFVATEGCVRAKPWARFGEAEVTSLLLPICTSGCAFFSIDLAVQSSSSDTRSIKLLEDILDWTPEEARCAGELEAISSPVCRPFKRSMKVGEMYVPIGCITR
jgi:hypothetical protein